MDKIGRYQVVRQLGHGGMGRVYLAADPALERDVALKLLIRDERRHQLRDEARALARLNHPCIVTIYEIGEHEGQDFLAMEYVAGKTLRRLLQEIDVRTRRDELLAICVKVAIAVGAAHRAGILHRDIKPENVLVTEARDVKVLDFGIARRLDQTNPRPSRAITAPPVADLAAIGAVPDERSATDTVVDAPTQTLFGTPAYMAPEILRGEPSTAASDVYSLGVLLYECLGGKRPYEATSLVEVIAQVIAGPPPRLRDPLGDLVADMLAPSARDRPTLDAVAARLAGAQRGPRPRSARKRWALATAAGVAFVALGVGAWQLVAATGPPRNARSVPAPAAASIAVAPIPVTMPSYGAEPPIPGAIADTLARLLGQTEGGRLTGIAIGATDVAAARREAGTLGAAYVVTGAVTEQDGVLHARVALDAVATGARVASVEASEPSPAIARLLDTVTDRLAAAVSPGARLARAPSRVRAEAFYRQGVGLVEAGQFTAARPYLEQATDADPTFFAAWYTLSLVLGWMGVAEPLVVGAIDKAIALAPPGPHRELARGVRHYARAEYPEARAVLEPLERALPADAPERRELLYYLGEANWHDGRHAAGFRYFKATLDRYPRFRPATVHPMQYAVARRDAESARWLAGLAVASTAAVEFAARQYAALAERGEAMALESTIVLDRPLPPALAARVEGDDLESALFAVARAIAAGNRELAVHAFDDGWRRYVAPHAGQPLPAATLTALESLGEVVMSAELVDEARRLVALLADQAKLQPVRFHARLAILTAALAGDASLVPTGRLIERHARLAEAARAELAGDREAAARILAELVADPTPSWDYPERAALIRQLRVLRRRRELAALCADTLEPAVFRPAYIVVRAACRARPR